MTRFARSGRAGSALPWWRRLRFGDVVILTGLPIIAGAYLLAGAVSDYARARLFDDWWSRSRSVASAFSARVRAALHTLEAIAVERTLTPDAPDAGTLSLFVDEDQWDAITAQPLAGFDTWVDAVIDRGASLEPARLRKRGDNSIHWTTPKTTFTLRTPRSGLFKGYRQLGFSTKDVLSQYLTNRLPREFDLLVPATRVVPVFLNRRFYGLFRMVETPDESFLRSNGAMPGNIFRGDAAERGEYYKGQPRDMFANLAIWDRTAANDRPTSTGPGQLRLLLEDVNGTTFADHLRLMARVDRDEVARLLAVMLITGDPYHMDDVHNQFWYEDPSTALLHPIPWDLRLLDLRKPGIRLNRFLRAALRDPFLVDETLRIVAERIRDGAILRLADSLVREPWNRYRNYFRYERLRAGLIQDVGTPDTVMAVLRSNVAFLDQWIGDARVAVHDAAVTPRTRMLDVETRGYTGVNVTGIDVAGATQGGEVRLDRNRNGVLDRADPRVEGTWSRGEGGLRFTPAEPITLLPGWRCEHMGAITPNPVHYRIFVEGDGRSASLVTANRITGQPVAPEPFGQATVSPSTSWSPWQYPVVRGEAHRWSGTVTLDETVVIPAGDTLIIAPGTTVRLGPDVSLIARGLMLARGAPGRLIRFVRADPARPWGTVSLQGHGADHSVWQYVHFVAGGGALVDGIEYIGMTNLHRADSVLVDHVIFEANVRSDDTFHALLARGVTLSHSRFIDANSDAVDFDMSSGVIVDNTFERSGGDAIDLMTSTPLIAGNVIRGSEDKGISIGEGSRPVVIANDIRDCARGIEIKDGSEPLIVHNTLVGNGTGLRSDLKNWRYGSGAWGKVINTVVLESRRDAVEMDSVSRLTVTGSVLGDDRATLADTADAAWVYDRAGLRVSERRPGVPAQWTLTTPVRPMAEAWYADDFERVADGWEPGAGARRITKRARSLRLTVQSRPGEMTLPTAFDLPSGGVLVAEVGGRDIAGAEIGALTGSKAVSRAFTVPADSTRFRYVAIQLPPGRYTGLRVRATPAPGLIKLQRSTGLLDVVSAELMLRGWWVQPARTAGE